MSTLDTRRPTRGRVIADNQSSLKAGLREKITHFDPERLPERIVYVRGLGERGSKNTARDVRGFAIKSEPHKQMPQAASAHDSEPQFGQLFRRNRTGGVLHRPCGTRH